MIVDFSKLDITERPVLLLKNGSGSTIGTLGYATNVVPDIKFNEVSTLEFELPEYVEGRRTPFYQSVIGMRTVELVGIGQFILMNPSEVGDGVIKTKHCKAYSSEYEFTFKKITLESSTYNLWNPSAPEGTIIGMILESMPSWSVGKIDSSLIGKYRTFSVSDTNLYNFMKGTLQESYNCIFDFDTCSRTINVIDASSSLPVNPVYLSNANLAKEIRVTEDTENIVTRLDVNGADGVSIRDVNPSGTNTIINLDYFMNTENFDQSLIDKYYRWKDAYQDYQSQYYTLSIEYSLQIMRRSTEEAALTELQNELISLENQQAVIIQGIAQELSTQADLDSINGCMRDKESEISEKKALLTAIEAEIQAIYESLRVINNNAKFENQFTDDELAVLDRYLKDDSVSESSFATVSTGTYSDSGVCETLSQEVVSFRDAVISFAESTSGKKVYTIRSGRMTLGEISADVISAAVEISRDGSVLITARLSVGVYNEDPFSGASVSITGRASNISEIEDNTETVELDCIITSGYLYFTLNTSEYEKRSVAWDLYEYGRKILEKISKPSYIFSISSANFLCLEDFISFKNSLKIGEKLYVGISEDETLEPICIGVKFSYDAWDQLELTFGDTYASGESSFLLADLLEKSVSMGKDVDLKKYTYSAFVDSGASTEVKTFMTTALDVSKNAIVSSRDQAITWGDSGIRLRKWTDESHSDYDPKQVWLNNNSILMTSSNWAQAEIAIGNFKDKNLGDCWGIVAPNIVGTLLAGQNLVIESAKKDGSNAVFKVDADGCVLYNSTFEILSQSKSTQIALDPQLGIVVGKYPVYSVSSDGKKTVNTTNSRFWVDTDGNLNFQGTLRAATGEFDGKVTAREGYIGNGSSGWTIGSTYLYNGKPSLNSTTSGIYIGTDGISIGSSTNYIKATKAGAFTANNAVITGSITATSGQIGGFTIDGNAITYNGLTWKGGGSGVYLGPSGLQLGPNFRVDSNGNLTANSGVFSGSVYAGNIVYGSDYGYLHGDGIKSQTIGGGKIKDSTITDGNMASHTLTTSSTGTGINTSLGYADYAYSCCVGWQAFGHISASEISFGSMYNSNGQGFSPKSVTITEKDGTQTRLFYWGW